MMSMFDARRRSILACSSIFLFCASAFAQTPAEETDLEKMRAKFQKVASQFDISAGDGTKLDLYPRPLVNWSNAERATQAGGMFMWTFQGRPAVAMCVYPNEPGYDHEFQSLSEQSLTAESKNRVVWQPEQPGITFRSLAGVEPSASLPIRLRQMRVIAREFSGRLVPPNKTPKPLRLQTTPAYRYPPPKTKTEVLDGALFTIVQGTDPEVLLMIEATESTDGKRAWRYGLARMTMVPMEVRHKDTLVMETTWPTNRSSLPYYVIKEYAGQ